MYIYSIIVGAATAVFCLSASSVVNCLGKKKILGMLIYSRNECIKTCWNILEKLHFLFFIYCLSLCNLSGSVVSE